MRLFIAISPPDDVKKRLALVARGLSKSFFRLAAPENYHLTLVFLGETAEEGVLSAGAALEEAASAFQPFECELSSVGAFPRAAEPRVVWMGFGRGAEEAGILSEALRTNLRGRRIGFDAKPFKAHITLAYARRRLRREDLAEAGRVFKDFLGGDGGGISGGGISGSGETGPDRKASRGRLDGPFGGLGEPVGFRAEEAVLFRSDSSPGGSVYTPVRRGRFASRQGF